MFIHLFQLLQEISLTLMLFPPGYSRRHRGCPHLPLSKGFLVSGPHSFNKNPYLVSQVLRAGGVNRGEVLALMVGHQTRRRVGVSKPRLPCACSMKRDERVAEGSVRVSTLIFSGAADGPPACTQVHHRTASLSSLLACFKFRSSVSTSTSSPAHPSVPPYPCSSSSSH